MRTKAFGHLRDVRRLVVATSRSRLGLYVFGRESLYKNCYELQPTFKQLVARPTKLALVQGEGFESCKRQLTDIPQYNKISGLEEMSVLVNQMAWEWQNKSSGGS